MRSILTVFLVLLVVAVSHGCGAPQDVGVDTAAAEPRRLVWEVVESEVRTGALNASDHLDDVGRRVDRYELRLQVGDTYRFVVRSADVDTTLTLTGPDGAVLYNDDLWDGTNSMLQFEARSADVYLLDVSTYGPDSMGLYELAVTDFDPTRATDRIEPDVSWRGRTSGGDPALGTSAAGWLHVRAGERLRLRVTSPDFDTTAWLFGPGGNHWFNDDANELGPDGTESLYDSTIEAVAAEDGWYMVVVAPYDNVSEGMFEVRATVMPPVVVAADQEIPDTGYAGVDGRGRIYGVFAGITDYGPGEELYGCADDATFLAEAFRQRRLQATADQAVLTDKAATRANFTAAIRRVAGKAGPDDVVVIFYSGHGGVVPVDVARDDAEIDGTDETLVFVDEEMRDNEFADLLDTLRAGTIVVALDACQSGGFARDIMTRPGRIGLFSSDEDVLSSTAEPVGAGGYLSYLMREAVLGAADYRPADGALHAGELADYLIEGGVTYHRNMNPEGDMSPLQRILVERGSYGWGDLLWVYPRNEDGTPIEGAACFRSEPAGAGPVGGGICR